MKKRIVFVAQALWIGGIESSLVNLLNQIDYDRYDVTCLVLCGETDLASHIPKQCRLLVSDRDHCITFSEPYPHHRLYHLTQQPQTFSKLRLVAWGVLRFLLRGFEMDRYAAYVRSQLKGERFNVCVIYSDRTAGVAVKAVNADRFLMYYHHGAMRHAFHDYYGYRKSERIVAVSEGVAQKLRKYRARYAKKIVMIHNLVDYERVREMSCEKKDLSFPVNCINIVSVGRVAEEKGMDLAVASCEQLVKKGFRDFHWWIVGDGPKMSELRQFVSDHNLEPYITLTGMQANPYPYIRSADLYVQPSHMEAFGLTIMEAAMLGKPIVSTATDGAKEIIEHGVNGFLCGDDVNSISDAIQQMIAFPERMKQYSDYWKSYDFAAYNRNQMVLFDRLTE